MNRYSLLIKIVALYLMYLNIIHENWVLLFFCIIYFFASISVDKDNAIRKKMHDEGRDKR
jgi:hypothetical protein